MSLAMTNLINIQNEKLYSYLDTFIEKYIYSMI